MLGAMDRKLLGFNDLGKDIQGVQFRDGLEVGKDGGAVA